MTPILDPRDGDIEDDASSTERRSMLWLAGSLLAEISLPKLVATWVLLIVLPGLLVGAAPLLVSIWIRAILSNLAGVFYELAPILILALLAAVGWIAGRPLLRLIESSFWSLNALAVQPVYVVFREGLRHLAEFRRGAQLKTAARARLRAGAAISAGAVTCTIGAGVILLVWPATRWVGTLAHFATPMGVVPMLLANGAVMIFGYLAVAAVVWGVADASMDQAQDLVDFAAPPDVGRTWRVAHLSDLHTVGEPYGFRIESGRSGPRGNARVQQTFACLDAVHAAQPLDLVLITGDMTDAGRSAEWAEFFAALAAHPALAERMVMLPGNHDVNVVDRASPARMELPTSPTKRLRQLRTISALSALQGARCHVTAPGSGRLGATLTAALAPHQAAVAAFADTGAMRLSWSLAKLWPAIFPLVLPPAEANGLGVMVMNSNAETHFSFTNALGLVCGEQARAVVATAAQYPRAGWIIALHHHVVEYPRPVKALSERIGTALINGTWFIRRLRPLAGRAVLMHGHRHVDWIGTCGGLLIVSAPSPVMAPRESTRTHFHVHTLSVGADGRLTLLPPQRVTVRFDTADPALSGNRTVAGNQ